MVASFETLHSPWSLSLFITPAGHASYRCPACPHVFQLTYTYEARKPGVKNKVSVRDITGVLKIGINTVLRTPKTRPETRNL